MPTRANSRSAKPAGARSSPSRLRSVVNSIIVISSEQFEPAVDVRLDRPYGLAERLGHLGIRKLLNVAQDHRLAVAWRQAGNTNRQLVHLGALHSPCLRARRVVGFAPIE